MNTRPRPQLSHRYFLKVLHLLSWPTCPPAHPAWVLSEQWHLEEVPLAFTSNICAGLCRRRGGVLPRGRGAQCGPCLGGTEKRGRTGLLSKAGCLQGGGGVSGPRVVARRWGGASTCGPFSTPMALKWGQVAISGGASGIAISGCQARGAAQRPTMQRADPLKKNSWTPNTSNARAQRPCPKKGSATFESIGRGGRGP